MFNTKYYQVYIVNPMTITPYSISESTKISDAYLNNVVSEARKVVTGVLKQGARKVGSALGRAKGVADDATKAATKNADDATKAATGTAAKNIDVLTPSEQAHLNPEKINVLKDFYKGAKGLYRGGREMWNRTPGWAKSLGGTISTIGGGYAVGDMLTGGKLTDFARWASDTSSEAQQNAYNNASQQNVNNTIKNNDQLNSEALGELDKGIGYGDGTAADTNRVGQLLYSMGYTDPNDSQLKPYTNLRNVLRQAEHSDDSAAGIQESKAAEHIKNAEEILARRRPIPTVSPAPTSDSAMRKATTIMAKGSAESQFPNTKLDPSDKSMMANLKDFVFDNPYLTASVLTLPVLTYIIAKHGAPLIDAIKRKGNNGVSGKEFVIVDNGKYLHSKGFSETVSKDIVIFKNKADAQSAINAMNAVTKSNYKIEELSKVIG